MLRKLIALLTAAFLLISLIGCATTNPDGTPNTAASTAGGAAGGALIGAGLGALIGLATGDVAGGAALGALVGAAAGGLGGFAYAKTQQKELRDRQAAEAMYKYNAQQGKRVIVEGVEVTPLATTQGENITMNTDFTVLDGSDKPMDVDVTRTIVYQGKQMGKPYSETAQFKSGSYSFSTPTKIPANAPEGKYKVVTLVKSGNAKDSRACEFLVTKKTASTEREIRLVSLNGVPVN